MTANIFTDIFAMSRRLAPWQNEAIRRLFTRGVLSPSDKEEIFEYAKIEHGIAPAPPEPMQLMLEPSDLPTPPAQGKRIQLRGVRELRNVNALKGDRLPIGNQLTIVYGENASGKSGYARVMKKAFRARAVEPILHNIYTSIVTPGPATAVFEIEEDGDIRDEIWTDGVPSPECLRRFVVFDSKCARVYIAESNQLTFVPYGFDIINNLAAITDEVKKWFQAIADASSPRGDTLQPLIDDTPTGRLLASLSASTQETDVVARARWTESDSKSLSSKEVELARLRVSSPKAIRDALTSQKNRLEMMRSEIASVSGVISDDGLGAIRSAVSDLGKYEEAVTVAAKLALGDVDFPGIGSDVWRELIQAAAKYSTQQAYEGEPYPAAVAGVRCVLCLQPLDVAARERLKRFWQFIQDDASAKRDAARRSVDKIRESLARVPRALPKHIQVIEDTLRPSELHTFEETKKYFGAVEGRVVGIESAISSKLWDSIPPAPVAPLAACDEEIARVVKLVGDVVDDGSTDAHIRVCENEVAELKARKRFTGSLPLVKNYVKKLKLSAAASLAAKKITTNAISMRARELQATYVTDAFRTRIRDELKPLGLSRIRAEIDNRTEKGRVLHKVVVNGVPHATPEAVFSEGERTAISLACFLAEIADSTEICGMIFDDPVSSLDHRIRAAVVKRLVAEAVTRQVIVFTHDLVVYRELVGAAERQNVNIAIQNVEALGATVGILSDTPPWDVLKVKQRITKLEQLVSSARELEAAGDIVEYRRVFREFYPLLRSTWERAVEELLFNQVVQRQEKEVKTNSLDGVQVDDASVEAVFNGMSRTSEMIDAHDHAIARNESLPGARQIAEDLDALKEFVKKQKDKRKAAEERLAHLKK